jgi:hypothetical protein
VWHFVETQEAENAQWAWTITRVDGSIESQSPPFGTYGMAVIDAIKKGFQPRREPWVVATQYTITHYRPGRPPLTEPVTDWASAPGVSGNKTRYARPSERGAKSRRDAVLEKQR